MASPKWVEDEYTRAGFEAALDGTLEDDTNFSIKIGNCVWSVHSEVFAAKSTYFKTICQGTKWQESIDRTSEPRNGDEPWAWARLLQFMYCGDYAYAGFEERGDDGFPVISAEKIMLAGAVKGGSTGGGFTCEGGHQAGPRSDVIMYRMADYYGIATLKEYCLKRMEKTCQREISCQFDEAFGDDSGKGTNVPLNYPTRLKDDLAFRNTVAKCIALQSQYRPGPDTELDQDDTKNPVDEWLEYDADLSLGVIKHAGRIMASLKKNVAAANTQRLESETEFSGHERAFAEFKKIYD